MFIKVGDTIINMSRAVWIDLHDIYRKDDGTAVDRVKVYFSYETGEDALVLRGGEADDLRDFLGQPDVVRDITGRAAPVLEGCANA
jgi:hypothetical protein